MANYEITNEIVRDVGILHISGDVLPPEFFQNIKFKNDKPDLLACLILANILYWYRPVKPRDEETGQPAPWRQRFPGNKLQCSYEALGGRYGATERQARDACARLRKMGLLTIDVKAVPSGGSVTMFEPIIEPIAAMLKQHSRLTAGRESGLTPQRESGLASERDPGLTPERESGSRPTHVETSVGIRQNVSRNTLERESSINTEINKEIIERERDARARGIKDFSPADCFEFPTQEPLLSEFEKALCQAKGWPLQTLQPDQFRQVKKYAGLITKAHPDSATPAVASLLPAYYGGQRWGLKFAFEDWAHIAGGKRGDNRRASGASVGRARSAENWEPMERAPREGLWGRLLEALDQRIGAQAVITWFEPLQFSLENDEIRLRAPQSIFEEWIQENYADALRGALASVGLEGCLVGFTQGGVE